MPFDARQCWICGDLDLQAMRAAVELLHKRALDYSAFAMGNHEPDYHGPVVKTVELRLESEASQVFILASCDRFLYKMVMLSGERTEYITYNTYVNQLIHILHILHSETDVIRMRFLIYP